MDLAKWAFKTLGNSALFRESTIWKEASPIFYSVLFPAKLPEKVKEKIEKETKAPNNDIQLDVGPELTEEARRAYEKAYNENALQYGPEQIIAPLPYGLEQYSPDSPAVNPTADPLTEPVLIADSGVPAEDIESAFDGTVIDYKVFFLE